MDVKNKKVVIVGSGDTAMALARLLLREGAKPIVTDMADGPKQQASRAILDELGVPCELGGHTDARPQPAGPDQPHELLHGIVGKASTANRCEIVLHIHEACTDSFASRPHHEARCHSWGG